MLLAAAGIQFSEGAEIQLVMVPAFSGTTENLTHILIDGKGVGCVRSSALASALMDTYLGKDSVAPEIRASVAAAVGSA